VLLPVALKARDLLPRAFTAAGAAVDVVPLYDTLLEDHDPDEVETVLGADYVTFTSSSAAEHFAALLRRDGHGEDLGRVRAASIGPLTTETVRTEGMELVLEASEYTVEGLAAALAAHSLAASVQTPAVG
jgi:uroporphyrinogen III methyltransferase/synthase